VYAVSAANPAHYRTQVGLFHLHHLPPRLIWGFETRTAGRARYPIADREKAFLDQLYLALVPRSPVGLPVRRTRSWDVDRDKIRAYARRFAYPPLDAWLRRNLVR